MEPQFLVIGSVLAMAVVGVVFATAGTSALIVVAGFAFTAVSNIFSNAYHIYQAEIFPTELRASATGWTYSLSRLATGAMPFVLLPLLASGGRPSCSRWSPPRWRWWPWTSRCWARGPRVGRWKRSILAEVW